MAKKIYLANGQYYGITDEMQDKMEGMWSLNTSAEINPLCLKNRQIKGSVCEHCYSKTTERRWEVCLLAYINNYHTLSENVLKDSELPLLNLAVFRHQAHGDLVNRTHYENLISITDANPKTHFALWTKNLKVINDGGLIKRDNLIYVYSTMMLNDTKPKLPKGFDKTFTVFTRPFVREHPMEINCQKKCLTCLKCYERNDDVHIYELIKSNGHSK